MADGQLAPRISWSVLIMGAGVLASVILNYAAYDTRISVLENTKLVDERTITALQKDVKALSDSVHDLDVRVKGAEHDMKNNAEKLKRIEQRVDKLDDKLDEK